MYTSPTPCMDCKTITAKKYYVAEAEHDPSIDQVAIRCDRCYKRNRRQKDPSLDVRTRELKRGVLSVYLDTLQTPGQRFHQGAWLSTMDMIKHCTPPELTGWGYQGLNWACQLKLMTRGVEVEKLGTDC